MRKKLALPVLLFLICSLLLTSCDIIFGGFTTTTHTVTFETNGGSEIAPIKVKAGDTLPEIAAPTREGYTFCGWYKDEALSYPWSMTGHKVESDMTLYASWKRADVKPPEPDVVSVKFNSNGGTAVDTIGISKGNKITKPADPAREGYSFIGWYIDAELTVLFDFNSAVTGSITLYAGWEKKDEPAPDSFIVTFETNGGSEINSVKVVSGSVLPPVNAPTKDGYDFDGWYIDSALTQPWDMSSDEVVSNMTLYAAWRERQTPDVFLVYFDLRDGSEASTVSVSEGEKLPKPADPTRAGYAFKGWYTNETCTVKYDFEAPLTESFTLYALWEKLPDIALSALSFSLTGASFESAYCEWQKLEGAEGYAAYCDGVKVDSELIRNYGTYMRLDVVGIKAGAHSIKVIPIKNGEEQPAFGAEFTAEPIAHVREGFAFVGGDANGAYNSDGTLKSGAIVLYVNNANKDTVTLKMQTGSSTYEDKAGIQTIIDALKKGYMKNPICIRFIGNITDPSYLQGGDILVDFGNTKFTSGMTIEGIGNDATFNGFGLRVKNSSNLEIRNLGFMNCNSNEGDNLGLQQDNRHVWVHNCDFFYGEKGSDADQAKGDGALDVKTSTYITLSFNHFFDSGKANLLGMKSETAENYITYHHNWYDHSDSRHPRVRTCTTHVYNNYYDGIAKYGIGATMGASIFVENNYFRNAGRAMSISLQGLDVANGAEGTFSGEAGGMIKAYGNYFVGGRTLIKYSDNNTSFDYYDASSRNEVVPSTVKSLVGANTYNNFDTSASMYSYNVETAEAARETVMKYAGRVQGGDFKWTFTDADDASYDVNAELKAALKSYSSALVLENNGNSGGSTGGNTGTETPVNPSIEGKVIHNFNDAGKESDFFSITGNLSKSKGTITYDGKELTQCLKLESSTVITFNLSSASTVTLVFNPTASIKVDGTKLTSATNVITVDLEAGSHTLTKADSTNLYYIVVEPKQ